MDEKKNKTSREIHFNNGCTLGVYLRRNRRGRRGRRAGAKTTKLNSKAKVYI